jgi:hypothetical protein
MAGFVSWDIGNPLIYLIGTCVLPVDLYSATQPIEPAPAAKRALLTGTLRSLEGVKATHGTHSGAYKAAAGWLARGVGMVRGRDTVRETQRQ